MVREFIVPPALLGTGRRPKLMVIGLGGTGSHFATGLARLQKSLMALGHPGFAVALLDGDTVSRSNVGRQCFYEADIGLHKVDCLLHRINMVYGFDWTGAPEFASPESVEAFDPDLLITCVDKAAFRAELGEAFHGYSTDKLWLDHGNGARSGQIVFGHLGVPFDSASRLPNVADLFPELATIADDDQPSCSMEEAMQRQEFPVNPMIAQLSITMLWQLIRHGSVDHHGYFMETAPRVTTRPLAIDEGAWAFMGYTGCPEVADDLIPY